MTENVRAAPGAGAKETNAPDGAAAQRGKLFREVVRDDLVGLRVDGEANDSGKEEHHRVRLLTC